MILMLSESSCIHFGGPHTSLSIDFKSKDPLV
jgi:hypothetical protein